MVLLQQQPGLEQTVELVRPAGYVLSWSLLKESFVGYQIYELLFLILELPCCDLLCIGPGNNGQKYYSFCQQLPGIQNHT